ncbi:hypothetical protein [Desulfofustis glycolicus]|uniref:Uncharacterized protein n=1 Tax=Desulfofustis glycolicus DSM 9705 TaxID=1121409 RepID=A0A1M5YUK7_9BACT|nr:hypothetical protein [Desulfofustis glycolicus]MCB2214827.1 hypothetical protein [Desulfobulbaceae bacterium]SHI15619.1 hypothetical protein SAMN02745124_04457 [Desulfofustis glycolicus DSM 9705]
MKWALHRKLLHLSELLHACSLQKIFLTAEDFPVFSINSQLITRAIKQELRPHSFVTSGDWDINSCGPIEKVRETTYTTIYDIFVHNKNYKSTAQYVQMRDGVQLYLEGKTSKPRGSYRCTSFQEIDHYFSMLHRAFLSIREDGYKSQFEIAIGRPCDIQRENDEIKVLIGRTGEVILGKGGTHRVIIAKLLGIEKVIVQLVGVHERFFQRQSIVSNSLQSAITDFLNTINP